MYKLIGLVLIFTASSAFGIYKAEELKRRLKLLKDLQQMLMRLSGEIGYFKEPLPEIFRRIADDDNQVSSMFLKNCHLEYQQCSNSLKDVWSKSIQDYFCDEPLTAEDLRLLRLMGDIMGQSDYATQEKQFKMLQEQIKFQISDAEEAVRTKGRLYSKAGMSVGAVIAVALI